MLLFFNCTEGVTYNETQSIPSTWNVDSIIKFDIKPATLNQAQNVFILFKHNADYPYKNIYLMVKMKDPKGNAVIDTLEYNLINEKTGKWLGKGITGTKENLFIYKEKNLFKQKGTYQIQIQHGMRTKNLDGVKNIGLIIQNTNYNE